MASNRKAIETNKPSQHDPTSSMDKVEVVIYIEIDLGLLHGTGWFVLGWPGSA